MPSVSRPSADHLDDGGVVVDDENADRFVSHRSHSHSPPNGSTSDTTTVRQPLVRRDCTQAVDTDARVDRDAGASRTRSRSHRSIACAAFLPGAHREDDRRRTRSRCRRRRTRPGSDRRAVLVGDDVAAARSARRSGAACREQRVRARADRHDHRVAVDRELGVHARTPARGGRSASGSAELHARRDDAR